MVAQYVPGLQGIPATESSVSYLDGEKGILTYRGYRIVDLANNSNFEEVAYLLMYGELPTAEQFEKFDTAIKENSRVKWNVRDIMKILPIDGHPMEMLQTCVASLGMFYPNDQMTNADREAYVDEMSIKVLAVMGTLVAMWNNIRKGDDPIPPRKDLSYAQNFLYMLHEREPSEVEAKVLDGCLILQAEHTINASTFASMVTASTLAAPNQVVSGAIGALAGPLHGGANQQVLDMLEEIGSPDHVEAWLDEQLSEKKVVWGFGHRAYKVKDPRADILYDMMCQLREEREGNVSPLFEVAEALEKAAAERLSAKGVYPNVDYYSGLVYTELGLPVDQFTPVFAIARTAGWLAHWREQLVNNRIFRPTQVYVGEQPRDYVDLNKR